MKPTKQQILDCNDKEQLERWAAEIAMGWHVKVSDGLRTGEDIILYPESGLKVSEYQPCHDTDLGRSQCWQLMVKYKMEVCFKCDIPHVLHSEGYDGEDMIADMKPQIAVAKAALLSEIGDE